MPSLYDVLPVHEIEYLQRYLATSPDPNEITEDKSLLMQALFLYTHSDFKLAVIELLLQYGVDVNWRDSTGQTIWTQAQEYGRIDARVVNALQQAGAHA